MKNTILLLAVMFCSVVAFGQIKVVGPSGDVKIGNTAVAPTEKLDVAGNARITGTSIFLGGDSGFQFLRTGGGSSRFNHTGTAQYQFNALNSASISFLTNNTPRMQISKNSGNLVLQTGNALKPGGGTWAVFSDKRLKKNINPFTDGLDEVMNINPVTFQYTKEVLKNNDKEFIGVIAQEVQEIAPYMTENADLYDDKGEVKSSDYLSVDPNAFTYMLINAVQEQQEIIQDQNELIKELMERMDAIENNIGNSTSSNTLQEAELNDIAELSQNEPNPFFEETIVKYSIPKNTNSAILVVTNMKGQVIKNIPLDLSSNQIALKANELGSGTYVYSLLIDGNIAQTRKMVLTK